MKEWSVALETVTGLGAGPEGPDRIDDLLATLSADSYPVASYDDASVIVRINIRASQLADALAMAITRVGDAFGGLGAEMTLTHVEVDDAAELDRRVQESDAPEILGVAELADLLGVTKQRVSELARSPSFPAPVAELASGPVWHKRQVARHVGHWPRRPGRPRKREIGA